MCAFFNTLRWYAGHLHWNSGDSTLKTKGNNRCALLYRSTAFDSLLRHPELMLLLPAASETAAGATALVDFVKPVRVDESFAQRFCAPSPTDPRLASANASATASASASAVDPAAATPTTAVGLAQDMFQTLRVQEDQALAEAAAGLAAAAAARLAAAAEAMPGGGINFTGEVGLTEEDILRRVKVGRYVRGTLAVKGRKTWQAYV